MSKKAYTKQCLKALDCIPKNNSFHQKFHEYSEKQNQPGNWEKKDPKIFTRENQGDE